MCEAGNAVRPRLRRQPSDELARARAGCGAEAPRRRRAGAAPRASARSSPTGTRKPLTPSSISSCAAPTPSVATSGSPAAAASFSTMPHGSERDGSTNASARRYHAATSSRSSAPVNRDAVVGERAQLGLRRARADEHELAGHVLERAQQHVEALLRVEPADVEEAHRPVARLVRPARRRSRRRRSGRSRSAPARRRTTARSRTTPARARRSRRTSARACASRARAARGRCARRARCSRPTRGSGCGASSRRRACARTRAGSTRRRRPRRARTAAVGRRAPWLSTSQRPPGRKLRPGTHVVLELPLLLVQVVERPARVLCGEEEHEQVEPLGERVEERDPVRRRDLGDERELHRRTTDATSLRATHGRRIRRDRAAAPGAGSRARRAGPRAPRSCARA